MTSNGTDNVGKGLRSLGMWIAIGSVLVALIVSGTVEKVRSTDQTISVKGFAEQRVISDTAVWRAWYVVRGRDLASAYTTLKQHGEWIDAFLREHGCPAEEIGRAPVSVQVEYKKTDKGVSTGEIEHHVLSASITVVSTNVDRVAAVAVDASSLIERGVELNSSLPEYYVSNLDRCKLNLLGAATSNARERAEQLAKNAGNTVGALRSASQGVFQITPVNSTDTSDYGTYDTRTIEKAVKAVVTVEFAIE